MSEASQHVLWALAAIYMAPTIIAALRLRADTLSIFVINLFLGWTFFFWVIELARAVSPKPRRA